MAQSKSFYDDIKKEIECPVCQEQFSDINEPKVLKCQHTFCKSCLEGWFRQQRGRTLSCPTCREITECPNNNINSLPSNLAYKNLGDILKAHSKTGGHDFVSERENVCKCHKEKIKFYCEQCAICICSDCIIIEHRDRNYHNIMSLEEGARKQKAIIERKMRQVAVNTSRLRSYTSSLEKRKAKADKSIDQATKELHRVVNSCINSLRRHEASVTELLTTEKSSYDDAFAKQLFEHTKKIQGMDNLSAQSKDALQRNNLQEMLNITQVLDERIVKEETLLLNCPEFKYIPNDALSLNLAPGKLYITNTEPSLSVATGEGLTKGTIGEECFFTVLTKNSRGQTIYSEIDKVNVEIKSKQEGIANIPSVVKDLKDGQYSISYRPNDAGEFSVSIKVREEPIKESPFKLMVAKKTVINDARRTVEHSPHILYDTSLQVSLFEELEDENHDDFEENIDENDITIIVSGILRSTPVYAVLDYFENSRRSGGGEVSNVDSTDDGETIITFLEVKDLQRLLEYPHVIDGKAMTVVRQRPKKKIPLDPVRIHVQGLSETTTEDCLCFYLEKFSDVEVEEVLFGYNNNVLVTFESEPDFESLFHKVNKDRKGLEGKKPRLERVPICSCILVTGLKKETTDDTIELYFENEKRSGGKDVSQVERRGRDQALVYFEDPSSVQSVIAKSQIRIHTLEGKTLEVKPHYVFLEK